MSIIIVVSPLNALMDDQVRFLSSKGISSVALGGLDSDDTSITIRKNIIHGHYQVIFNSPERLVADKEWRDVFQCELLHECVVGFIVDEAHCVQRGTEILMWFLTSI